MPLESLDWTEILLKMTTTCFFKKEGTLLEKSTTAYQEKNGRSQLNIIFWEMTFTHERVLRKEDSL